MRGRIVLLAVVVAACSGTENPADVAAPDCPAMPAQDYAWIPGATFTMGADPHLPEEGPPREISLPGFWIATHEVTNAEFAAFVRATNYRTLAEREPPALAGAPPEMFEPGSAVFTIPDDGDPRWWRWVVGAQWRHPAGPASTVQRRDREPVVQVGYEDALAYARWSGKALPSEAQWELAAASGGADRQTPADAQGKPLANYYQGVFPARDLGTDGFRGRAPVACFPPDRHGVHDLIGNVWEWTTAAVDRERNVIKGGSFLCAANYCARYRPAARQFQERGLGTDHIGFRLVDTTRTPPPAPQQPDRQGEQREPTHRP